MSGGIGSSRHIVLSRLREPFFFGLIIATFFLTGCGGRDTPGLTPTTPATPKNYADMTGNWQLQGVVQPVQPSIVIFPYVLFGASLTSTKGQVAGVMRIQRDQCGGQRRGPYLGSEAVPLTGSIELDGNFSLKATTASGTTVTASGLVSADGTTLSNGTFAVVEATCSSSGGTLDGSRVPPVTGTWVANISFDMVTGFGSTAKTATVTEQWVQAATADDQGFFPITGTATVQGLSCLDSMDAAAPFSLTGSINGNQGNVSFSDKDGQTLTLAIEGVSNPTYTEATLEGGATSCGYREGSVSLVKQ